MENMRKRIRIELISSPERLSKLVNQPTFNDCIKYGERLCAVIMDTKMVKFIKPIYVGLAVLDISKTLMYKYFYDVLKPHYGDAISLVYMDTGEYNRTVEIFLQYLYIFNFSQTPSYTCSESATSTRI